MDLFVRESGPIGAPAIVFLHGGYMSGWSWQPVVDRLHERYRCLVPDLPQYGNSAQQRPFELGPAAEAVATLIRSQAASGQAHVVGFSLGGQVALQLLATEPNVVDRAVLCGTPINTMPYLRLTKFLVSRLARTKWFQWLIKRHWNTRHARLPFPNIDDYREDRRLMTGAQLANIVVASSGFAIPEGLDKSDAATLFVTGTDELPISRRWAAKLAHQMPNAVAGLAIGMRHDWPLRYPDLFAGTVEGWLAEFALPPQIGLLSTRPD